jgi:hypothetical protein
MRYHLCFILQVFWGCFCLAMEGKFTIHFAQAGLNLRFYEVAGMFFLSNLDSVVGGDEVGGGRVWRNLMNR